MLKLVIFDLDGVIVDTAKYHYLAWRELGYELGIEFTQEQNEAFKGVSRLACMDIMCTLANKEDMPQDERNRIANKKNDIYLELIKDITNSELLAGVENLLRELKQAGIKVALGSASKNAVPILKKTGILHYFDTVIDGNKVKKAKPDPEVFELAAQTAEVANAECVVFEDATAGVEAAIAAGMAVVGIGTKESLPNAEVVFANVGEVSVEFLLRAVTNDRYRPKYHISVPAGWLNDPNGLIFYKGEYHVFYQHYPHDTVWGPMHWGHAKSKDLIRWEYLPIALAPDMDHENVGCFSGSAIEHDGKLYLIYTGAADDANGTHLQTQCVAYSEDGINFTKYEGNPVLTAADLPEDCQVNAGEFRDPKVFKKDDAFYMVVVAKAAAGNILLYKSRDLLSWEYVRAIANGEGGNMGVMFECPDLFELDGKDVLITSPIAIKRSGHRFFNTSSTLYFGGKMNWETGEYAKECHDEIDIGTDFYAPQTLCDDRGRRIMIAWAQMWHRTMPTNVLRHNWAGSFSIPRALKWKDEKLMQTPVEELRAHRVDHVMYRGEKVEGVRRFDGVAGDVCELVVNVDMGDANNFSIAVLKTENEKVVIWLDDSRITIDRSCMGNPILGNESIPVNSRWIPYHKKTVKLDILIDKSIVEVFVNDGEYAMTVTAYPEGTAAEIEFFADGAAVIDIDKWNI